MATTDPFTDPFRVNPLEDHLSRFVPVDQTVSEEERRRLMEEGKIPVPTFQPSFTDAIPIQLDTSRTQEALREFARAKVQAANAGSSFARIGAEAANMRLLASALGPAAFQFISGAQFDTGVEQARDQATGAIAAYQQALADAVQQGIISQAEAEIEIARMQDAQDFDNARAVEETRRFNEENRNREEEARVQGQRDAFKLGFEECQGAIDFQRNQQLERERQAAIAARQNARDVRERRAYMQQALSLNRQMSDIDDQLNAVAQATSILRGPFSDEQKQQVRNNLIAAGIAPEGMIDIGDSELVSILNDRADDLQRVKLGLIRERNKTTLFLTAEEQNEVNKDYNIEEAHSRIPTNILGTPTPQSQTGLGADLQPDPAVQDETTTPKSKPLTRDSKLQSLLRK